MRFRIHDDKTGFPSHDNLARKKNLKLHKSVYNFTINTPRGRKRKKQIRVVEGEKYARLLNLMIEEIIRERSNKG